MKICLLFYGQAEAAMKFYQSVFKDTKVLGVFRREGKFICGNFRIKRQDFMVLNGPRVKFSMGVSIMVNCKTQREVDTIWKKLTREGEESVCGWLTDKYGVSWQIIPEGMEKFLGARDRVKAERAFQAMVKMRKIDINVIKKAYNGK